MARDVQTYEMTDSELAQTVGNLISGYQSIRSKWERNWFDNNFFDDGFHYRFVSPETDRVIDYSDVNSVYTPRRSIPKSSRQLRGMANLLIANRPTPVVYPDKFLRENFADEQVYEMARKQGAQLARRVGHWLQNEWDEQELTNVKLPLMMVLAGKHAVSYLKIWPDSVKEQIRTQVRDAFDIWLDGKLENINDNQVIIETYTGFVNEIKANELYDEEAREKVRDDGKEAESATKQAYLRSKHGGVKKDSRATATTSVREAYFKEYVNKKIIKEIRKQPDAELILKRFGEGDPIIRHVVVAGGQTLRKVYTNFSEYPIVPFAFEPGPLYQTPLLDRFKHQNKSYDNVISRIEQWIYLMASGKWWKREGENWTVDNTPGGQVVTSATMPQQIPLGNMPATLFNYLQLMTSNIEEQGVTTTALGKVPNDIRSGVAIESLKSSEYANLTIALEQLKKTVKITAEKMLGIAHDYFVTPQTVFYMQQGVPDYFDIIGQRGVELHNELGEEGVINNAIPLKRDYKVKIEIESGLGYTMEGKRANAIQLANYMLELAQAGMVPPEAIKEVIKRLLETYQFGGLSDIMEVLDKYQGQSNLTNDQIQQMKIALAETARDIGLTGQGKQEEQVQASKVGTVEALQDIVKAGGE